MTAWDVERVIEARARAQHGAFHHQQADAAGASNRMIRARLATGRWLELDHLVYAHASSLPTFERQIRAATLAVPHGAASRSTAAWVHGFPGARKGQIHVVTALPDAHRSRIAIVHRSRVAEVTRRSGIPVVTPAHCFFELAGSMARARLRSMLHDALQSSPGLLAAVQDRYVDLARSRLPGIGHMRLLLGELGDGDRPTESELERRLLAVVGRLADPPELIVQPDAPWAASPGSARVDVLCPAWSAILEADGRAWHTRVDDFERDRWRDVEAAAHGLQVLRFTWTRLTTQPSGVIDQLERIAARHRAAAQSSRAPTSVGSSGPEAVALDPTDESTPDRLGPPRSKRSLSTQPTGQGVRRPP